MIGTHPKDDQGGMECSAHLSPLTHISAYPRPNQQQYIILRLFIYIHITDILKQYFIIVHLVGFLAQSNVFLPSKL